MLRLQHTITEKRVMSKRPDVGLVRTIWEMFNQNGDKVLHMEGYGMFRGRCPPRGLIRLGAARCRIVRAPTLRRCAGRCPPRGLIRLGAARRRIVRAPRSAAQ